MNIEETLQTLWDSLVALATNVGGKLIGAILVLIIGKVIIVADICEIATGGVYLLRYYNLAN